MAAHGRVRWGSVHPTRLCHRGGATPLAVCQWGGHRPSGVAAPPQWGGRGTPVGKQNTPGGGEAKHPIGSEAAAAAAAAAAATAMAAAAAAMAALERIGDSEEASAITEAIGLSMAAGAGHSA